MNTEIKTLNFDIHSEAEEYLRKKITRIHVSKNMIVDILVTLRRCKWYEADVTVNFRWGVSIHVRERGYKLKTVIDKVMKKLNAKIKKEKEKVMEK